MSNEIMVRNSSSPAPRYPNGNLNRQMGRYRQNAQAITDAAVAAMNEISYTSGYGQYIAVQTLDRADWIRQARRGRAMSPAEKAAYQQQDQQYLNAINQVTRIAHMRIVLGMQQMALPDANADGNWLDRLDEFFFTRRF